MLIGSVDAIVIPTRDGNPQVTRNGNKRDLSLVRAEDGNNHCIGAEGCAGAFVGTDQQEINGLLSVVENLTTGRVNGGKGRDRIDEEVRVNGRD